MNSHKKLCLIACILISLTLLIPGVTQPVLTITGTIDKSKLASNGINMMIDEQDSHSHRILNMASSMLGLNSLEGEILAYHKSRSILGTAQKLIEENNTIVGLLIILFSIAIPVTKILMQLSLIIMPWPKVTQKVANLISSLSKWSMADVFVMALIVSYMAGQSDANSKDLVKMHSQFEIGFYLFLAYCLFSLAADALLKTELASYTQTTSKC